MPSAREVSRKASAPVAIWLSFSCLLGCGDSEVLAAEAEVLSWPAPYDYSGVPERTRFAPASRAKRSWSLCASYPHLKDAYWISVNYGMVEQAMSAGVRLKVVEAGGYPNVERQIEQIRSCSRHADALIVGAVSYSGLSDVVREIATRIPVVAAVNDMEDAGIAAKVGVPWKEMGGAIGSYLAQRHPIGGAPATIAWFPGPEHAGWVDFVEDGFRRALRGSSASVTIVKRGDTGQEIQARLIEEVLESRLPLDYLVGSAVTADAAVTILRDPPSAPRIQVLADYFTHGTYRAIKRGKVLAAPTDAPVLQGRLAVDQAIRAIERTIEHKHVGPAITLVDRANVDQIDLDESLAPGSFAPRFQVP